MGDKLVHAGRLHRKAFFNADIRAARASLAATNSDRLYLSEEEVEFDFVEHFDSVDAWMSCLARPRVGELVADERLIESACAKMVAGQAEIILTERERATRLKRLG